MQLVVLILLLVGPYPVLTMAGRWSRRLQVAPATRARVGLTLFFLFTAVGHFVRTDEMAAMVTPPIPYPVETIYVTGVLEALGAVGVWVPRVARLAGLGLIVMLIGLLPANIYSAVNRVEFGGHGAGPVYLLVRVPFQLFVIWWAYFATGQRWPGGARRPPLTRTSPRADGRLPAASATWRSSRDGQLERPALSHHRAGGPWIPRPRREGEGRVRGG